MTYDQEWTIVCALIAFCTGYAGFITGWSKGRSEGYDRGYADGMKLPKGGTGDA